LSRSPLAYPLVRGIDGDSGGAADLQTDIMRFMAILALCLVAIFALVQSIPLAPEIPIEVVAETAQAEPVIEAQDPVTAPTVEAAKPIVEKLTEIVDTTPPSHMQAVAKPQVTLARPKWVPKFQPQTPQKPPPMPEARATETPEPAPSMEKASLPSVVQTKTPSEPQDEKGFTLRFESDLVLTRLVAAGHVGFYAIDAGRAQRMAVSESRISFWEASTPNSFHEMEATTVPRPVIEALSRTGADARSVDWGVTLPGKLRNQLSTLMREHSSGALVIGADGNLNLEAS